MRLPVSSYCKNPRSKVSRSYGLPARLLLMPSLGQGAPGSPTFATFDAPGCPRYLSHAGREHKRGRDHEVLRVGEQPSSLLRAEQERHRDDAHAAGCPAQVLGQYFVHLGFGSSNAAPNQAQ
jgi:hypothetical protein